jgi:hypothetical protein
MLKGLNKTTGWGGKTPMGPLASFHSHEKTRKKLYFFVFKTPL